ncbi:MAG TPA: biotin carboxylase N-terminal domain-containing protein, partial [Thermopolyspora sp.]
MRKLLVANRGEIAVRVLRTARELGISTVAIYSEADRDALHVRLADERVLIGPPAASRSYLNMDAIVTAAVDLGADAVHPGYGFLSERAEFAERVSKANITFVGPSADTIRLMGDKARARSAAEEAGVPTVPGSDGPVDGLPEALAAAERAGY